MQLGGNSETLSPEKKSIFIFSPLPPPLIISSITNLTEQQICKKTKNKKKAKGDITQNNGQAEFTLNIQDVFLLPIEYRNKMVLCVCFFFFFFF